VVPMTQGQRSHRKKKKKIKTHQKHSPSSAPQTLTPNTTFMEPVHDDRRARPIAHLQTPSEPFSPHVKHSNHSWGVYVVPVAR
jgi:hypothetical protein